MNTEKIVDMIVRAMIARENEGKEFGVIVLAEGLAQYLPSQLPRGRDSSTITATSRCRRPTWPGT